MNKKYFFNLPDYKFEFFSSYNYNFYEKNETYRSDKNIENSTINSSKCILSINYNEKSNAKKSEFIQAIDYDYLESLEQIKDIDVKYFNFIDSFETDFLKIKSENRIVDTKESFITNGNYSKDFLVNSVSKNYEFIMNSLKDTDIISNDVFTNFWNLNFSRSEKAESSTSYIDSFSQTIGMRPFKETLVYESNVKNIVNVGFLVEKYNRGKKLGTRFYSKKIFYKASAGGFSNKFEILDYNVKYGETYEYKCYPVFYSCVCKENDYHIKQHYLICDNYVSSKVDAIEKVRPDCPQGVLAYYYKNKDKCSITWNMPKNDQNDIKGYHVYKRYSIDEPYTLVGVIDFTNENDFYKPENDQRFNNNIIHKTSYNLMKYHDYDFDKNRINIYAVVSFDAHGMFSNYSDQIAVLYNAVKKNLMVDLLSLKNAPLHMPNLYLKKSTKFFNNEEKIETILPIIKNKNKISLYFAPDFVRIKKFDGDEENMIKENYVFKIFKLENQADFNDDIKIDNFNQQ
jgi:hypothetical protein